MVAEVAAGEGRRAGRTLTMAKNEGKCWGCKAELTPQAITARGACAACGQDLSDEAYIALLKQQRDQAVCLVIEAVTNEDGLDGGSVPDWIMKRAEEIAEAVVASAEGKTWQSPPPRSWVKADGTTNEFICERCLAREPISLPARMDQVVAQGNAFGERHKDC
jgi:hypothetical protein